LLCVDIISEHDVPQSAKKTHRQSSVQTRKIALQLIGLRESGCYKVSFSNICNLDCWALLTINEDDAVVDRRGQGRATTRIVIRPHSLRVWQQSRRRQYQIQVKPLLNIARKKNLCLHVQVSHSTHAQVSTIDPRV